MKNQYLGETILFLTDVPYVISGRGTNIFDNGIKNIFVNKINSFNIEK